MNGDIADRAQRVERIGALLGEIEELSHRAHDVPLPLLIQTLETLETARNVLKNYARLTIADADPQPDIDGDILDRMYRTLALGRRASGR
jgi:hypothetical protein